MTWETDSKRGVRNQYGVRLSGGGSGVVKTEGFDNEMTVEVSGDLLNSPDTLPAIVIPAKSRIVEAYAEVTEAFVLGGTTPTVLVGTAGSEVTNGVVLDEASAEAANYYDLTATLAGTWDEAVLAADTTVGIALGGTTPTAEAGTGYARIVVKYRKVGA